MTRPGTQRFRRAATGIAAGGLGGATAFAGLKGVQVFQRRRAAKRPAVKTPGVKRRGAGLTLSKGMGIFRSKRPTRKGAVFRRFNNSRVGRSRFGRWVGGQVMKGNMHKYIMPMMMQ